MGSKSTYTAFKCFISLHKTSYGGVIKRMCCCKCLWKSMQQNKVLQHKKAATCKILQNSCYMVYTVSLLLSFLYIPSYNHSWWYESCMTWFLPFLKRHVDKAFLVSDAMNIVQVQMTIKTDIIWTRLWFLKFICYF